MKQSNGSPDWKITVLQERLQIETRRLRVLERQASIYTALNLPVDLAIRLEDQRVLVSQLLQHFSQLSDELGENYLRVNDSEDFEWRRSYEDIGKVLRDLELYCPPLFVDAFYRQVIQASAYRQQMTWHIALEPSKSSSPDQAIKAVLTQRYIVIPGERNESPGRQSVVYHVPPWLSARGRLKSVSITVAPGDRKFEFSTKDLARYQEKSEQGIFYRIHYPLRRGETAIVEAHAIAFHPRKSEEILLSYYPCYGLTAEVEVARYHSARFRLFAESYLPGTSITKPLEVRNDKKTQLTVYSLEGALLPYQGIRLSWHYRGSFGNRN